LSYLHSFSPPVIHRDIKPNNIKLKPDGTIVLLDFGLAKGTAVSVVSGGSSYSSLEQLNLSATDPRSDLYAFGATLYHLLTNSCPPSAIDRFRESCAANFPVSGALSDKTFLPTAAHKSVSETNPHVPPEISEIVMKAMSLFPEERFQTAAEMKLALQTAKQNLGDAWAAFENINIGAPTRIDNPKNIGAMKSLLDEDEENLKIWTSEKSNISENSVKTEKFDFVPNSEPNFPPDNAPGGEISPTQFVSRSRFEGKTGEATVRFPTENEHTAFETPRLPDQKPPPKIGKLLPVMFGGFALLAFSLIGLAAWYFFSPTGKAEKPDAAKTEQSPTVPQKSGAAIENPLKVSAYLVARDGKESKIDENHLFADEEQFRFRVKPAADGFLYVISRNNQDKLLLAYPKPNQVDNSIKKDSESAFPRDDGKFQINRDSPSEMWAYFVVVASREDDLAKRIRTTLGGNQEKNLAASEVSGLMKDLDKLAEDSVKEPENRAGSTTNASVEIVKIQKKQ